MHYENIMKFIVLSITKHLFKLQRIFLSKTKLRICLRGFKHKLTK